MEVILAIVVASAVILFGALISMGNERQRKAIDGLREQVVLWAVQDIKIKRTGMAREVKMDDPLGWLSHITGRILGRETRLKVLEVFQDPQTLVCTTDDKNHEKFIFSIHSPGDLKRLVSGRQNRLSNFALGNPLLSLPRKATSIELSVLNCDFLFDLELPLVWNALTGWRAERADRLWVYLLPD